ncbi:MAG: hypothetical protein JSS04_12035 [Proteobacteria bacterium]|nr:hypothetical protein [Pseudomonadota bacterium]
MYRQLLVGTVTLAGLLLASCKQDLPSSPQATIAPAPTPSVSVEDLRKLRGQIFLLQQRVAALESGGATVSTEEEGYDVARTKFGPLTVSSRGAAPYLDGYKVELRIGNLTNANFDGVKLNLAWGPPGDANTDFVQWSKAQKTKQLDLTTKLAAGAFTDVEVVLTPAKPDEIKSFTVGFELNQLELRSR